MIFDEQLYFEDRYLNLNWGVDFIKNYNIFHDSQPPKTVLKIRPMFNDLKEIIGFIFSFQNDQIATARPLTIFEKHLNFTNNFFTNYVDHIRMSDKHKAQNYF
jgi:hypothetical protein